MGKTIALKLTEKEQHIVAQFNKQGLSNSDLLRNALHQYIANISEFSSTGDKIENVFINDKKEQIRVSESFVELKQEMQHLREQLTKTQKQIESNMMSLERTLYLFSISNPISQQLPSPITLDIAQDIHQQVDEFLNKRLQKVGE
ncbi:hypothetical protein AYK25_02005 [Thermoplasmatales archaeon SM1-50]|nr:MAG: hypothetical protein AYK25_02005 [Thermoplasmatales archaeon SM1-50]